MEQITNTLFFEFKQVNEEGEDLTYRITFKPKSQNDKSLFKKAIKGEYNQEEKEVFDKYLKMAIKHICPECTIHDVSKMNSKNEIDIIVIKD